MIFDALINDSLFDVYIEALNWGQCSWISENSKQTQKIKECVNKLHIVKQQNGGQLPQFDLFIHVTIPNEFERLGKLNVGVTAMVETNMISHQWVRKLNEMDLVIVPSEHSKNIAQKTIIDWQNPNTGENGIWKVEVPIFVCAEGVDVNIFKKKEYKNLLNLELDSDFNFIHVGQWGNGNFGEDRKNISLMLKYFLETFRGRKDVGLVLKTNMAKNSNMDFEFVKARLNDLKAAVGIPQEECPPIYLVHANLSTEEMADLYNHPKIKAFLTLTHGERISEFLFLKLPVVSFQFLQQIGLDIWIF